MSHLPGLSDYVGEKQPSSAASRVTSQSSGSERIVSNPADSLLVSNEQQIKYIFAGMSRSLGSSIARVSRNKKVCVLSQPVIERNSNATLSFLHYLQIRFLLHFVEL